MALPVVLGIARAAFSAMGKTATSASASQFARGAALQAGAGMLSGGSGGSSSPSSSSSMKPIGQNPGYKDGMPLRGA
jgi:hypothetical protein